MTLVRINHNPTNRQLSVFGVSWLVFFGIVGAIVLHRTGSLTTAAAVWIGAATVAAIGWMVPSLMRRLYVGMSYAAMPIGMIVSLAVLAVVYYLVMTPIACLMRLCGYDPLCRRFDRNAASYWVKRKDEAGVERYFRQY